jgi:rubredoxin-NAD+ reductase
MPPPLQLVAAGGWHAEHGERHTICRFYDDAGILRGFGVAPQDAAVRQRLSAELGSHRQATAEPVSG